MQNSTYENRLLRKNARRRMERRSEGNNEPFSQDQHSCPWRIETECRQSRNYQITGIPEYRNTEPYSQTSILANGELKRITGRAGLAGIPDYRITGLPELPAEPALP